MAETVIYEAPGIQVTSARFVVANQTFAVANITSVSANVTRPNLLWPTLIMVFGALMLYYGIDDYKKQDAGQCVVGGLIVFFCFLWLLMQKSVFHVILRTAGIEQKAYSSVDSSLIFGLVDALNDAIVSRG